MSKVEDVESVVSALGLGSVLWFCSEEGGGGSESRSPRMAWAENVAVGTVDAVAVVAVPVLVEEGCVDDSNTVLYLSTIALEISMPKA